MARTRALIGFVIPVVFSVWYCCLSPCGLVVGHVALADDVNGTVSPSTVAAHEKPASQPASAQTRGAAEAPATSPGGKTPVFTSYRPPSPTEYRDGKVRFIRLKHGGPGWDNGFNDGDVNFLQALRTITGFAVAGSGEAYPIAALRKIVPGRAPPFVYLTGTGEFSLDKDDSAAIREYCLKEGGMVLADNSGGGFDEPLVAQMKQVFADLEWVAVPKGDTILRIPFAFPDGAPMLAAPAGKTSLQGIKFKDRWVVLYHRGGLMNAWKTRSNDQVTKEAQGFARNLGINVVYYCFTTYAGLHPQLLR